MSNPKAASRRPPIHILEDEADTLFNLALSAEERSPELSALLMGELERATIHKSGRIPEDIVTMQATVEFVDEASGKTNSYQLVYPRDADISGGRISIMTPVGAGLIGLREGQSILWPDREGHERKLTIIKVTQQAKAA